MCFTYAEEGLTYSEQESYMGSYEYIIAATVGTTLTVTAAAAYHCYSMYNTGHIHQE